MEYNLQQTIESYGEIAVVSALLAHFDHLIQEGVTLSSEDKEFLGQQITNMRQLVAQL